MKLIRIRFVLLISCLAVCYSLERFFESLNVSEPTFMIALIAAIVTLVIPYVVEIPTWMTMSAVISLTLLYKNLTGTLFNGYSVGIILMELSLISVATLLAVWVNKAINEFKSTIEHITIGNQVKALEFDSQGQTLLYREVRRARNHQRPLTLMKIEVDENSVEINLDRMVQEAQQTMKKQYALSTVSKALCDKFEDSDTIIKMEDYFLIALPELCPEDIPSLIERLRKQVTGNVGISLKIGSASLPWDGYTLEGLLEKASSELDSEMEPVKFFEVVR